MRRLFVFVALCLAAASAGRTTLPFDSNWRFLKADASGAEAPGFDDSGWRTVEVPHDWAIEGPFDERNPTRGAGAFLPAGIGWYRRHFIAPPDWAGQRISIEFDGVMANSDVWVNDFHLGKRPYGYVSFAYDLTDHLNFNGKDNVLAVRADNSLQPASRWFPGAGIYRHVRLVVQNPVHIERWSTFATTPEITTNRAVVRLETTVTNESDAARTVTVSTGSTETKPQAIQPGQSAKFTVDYVVPSPTRWSLEDPYLNGAAVQVKDGKTVLDSETIPFGIREFHFDPATGFWLNGKNLKIKGVCLHADGGAVGAAVPIGVWEYRLATLKKLGVNAIRCAHNPPAPEFLDLCDRMGFLVMDEMFDCWTVAKNPNDYHLYFRDWSHRDTADTVRRDRNHPSIILYSAGNEIHDTPEPDIAIPILKGLVEVFHVNDPTRPVTQALFRPNVSHDYDDGLADLLDMVGQNYRENEILAAHAQKPTRKIIGTENQHGREVWLALRDNPPYAGQFLWSGIDYLGESRFWPVVTNPSGILDRTGAIKPIGYQRQSWWSSEPMAYLARRVASNRPPVIDPGYETAAQQQQQRRAVQTLYSDWTPENSSPHDENVEVYSNCDEVELLLNGKSLGSKPLPADASSRNWQVAYASGKLEAIGKNKGQIAARYELRTAGKPAKIVLAPSGKGASPYGAIVFVTAAVSDANGVPVPNSDAVISFRLEGLGSIIATDNADNSSHESYQSKQRHAYEGRAVALVKTGGGSGEVTATSPGLVPGTAHISVAVP
jgi:beta-galactosidase